MLLLSFRSNGQRSRSCQRSRSGQMSRSLECKFRSIMPTAIIIDLLFLVGMNTELFQISRSNVKVIGMQNIGDVHTIFVCSKMWDTEECRGVDHL